MYLSRQLHICHDSCIFVTTAAYLSRRLHICHTALFSGFKKSCSCAYCLVMSMPCICVFLLRRPEFFCCVYIWNTFLYLGLSLRPCSRREPCGGSQCRYIYKQVNASSQQAGHRLGEPKQVMVTFFLLMQQIVHL